jgi:(S)-3,5-dihydroxyphenylglycine transaminase
MAPFYLDGDGVHQLRLSCSYVRPEQIDEGVGRLARFIHSRVPAPAG